ncbi:MAG: prepilin peptidase [Kiritimatiellae bacterium]|nr:prepilin peptidase [Kiritimatiellia bacterium]
MASFLNVVIWRVPRGESIERPPSHCPKCGASIRWWQNIPILSWLALRGKCAACKAPISPRYLFVELLGGALFLSAFLHFDAIGARFPEWGDLVVMFELLVWWIWISLMIVGSFIDFDHKLLPDFVTVGGMVLGCARGCFWSLVSMLESPKCAFSLAGFAPLLWSLAGLAFGFGLLWLVRYLGSKAFKREAMGMGDVFLMGAVGALFGLPAVLGTLILSSVFGSVAGIALMLVSRIRPGRFVEIPYGPYICLGCLVCMFYGNELYSWYMNIFR